MKEAAPEMTLPPFLSLGRAAISAKAQQEDFAALTRIELSSEHVLEPKYGWGHEDFKKQLATQIEQLEIDYSWTPKEVLRYVARLIREL